MKTAPSSSPDGTISNQQLRQLVIAGKGKDETLTHYAAKLKVSFQFLGKVIKGDYAPGPTIAKALGYEQVITVRFRKKQPRKAARVPKVKK